MRNLAMAIGAAAAITLAFTACPAAPATPTKPAATPTRPAATTPAVTTPAAMTTPAGAMTPAAAAGSADAGKQLIVSKGCASCHTVPGVPEAKGTTAPNLGGLAARPQIAGTLPNNAENLAKWLKNPPGAKPGTAMPNLNLSDKEIADLSAFLMTLR